MPLLPNQYLPPRIARLSGDTISLAGIDRRKGAVLNLLDPASLSSVVIPPVIQHVNQIDRPVDHTARVAFDGRTPRGVVVDLMGVERQRREAE